MSLIPIMGSRYQTLEKLAAAIQRVDVPFIGFDGTQLVVAGGSDDLGAYYFIPQIIKFFGVSLDNAVLLFYYGLTSVSFFLGVMGFWLLFKNSFSRITSFFMLFGLSVLSLKIGDVYTAYSLSSMAIVPLFLYFIAEKKNSYVFYLFLFLSGMTIGFFDNIRAFSAVGTLFFMIMLLLSDADLSFKKKPLLFVVLLSGLLIFPIYFNKLNQQHVIFASENIVGYQKASSKHVFWHSIYIGFGFLTNDWGIRYDDIIGMEKALEIDKEAICPSEKYENVIKGEVIKLFKSNPSFIFQTIFAKLGAILSFIVLPGRFGFGWTLDWGIDWRILFTLLFNALNLFGICCSLVYRKSWKLEVAFFFAIGFNALFGVMIMPFINYLLGFIAFLILYSTVSIGYAIEQGFADKLRSMSLRRGKLSTSS